MERNAAEGCTAAAALYRAGAQLWQSDRIPRVSMTHDRIYLDHAATTPLLPEARGGDRARLATPGPIPARPMPKDARRAPCWKKRGDASRRCSAGVMTSSSPRARARRSRSSRRGRAAPGERIVARSSMRSCRTRWARRRRSSRSRPDGLIDDAALDAALADGPALVAIQPVNNETGVIQPLDRLAPQDPRGGVAAARRLRAERRQAAAARRRFHRRCRRTSSAARRGSARCWSGTSRRSSRSAGRRSGYRRGTAGRCRAHGLRRRARGRSL